ncbi:Maf family protein [Phycisphaerales bacterium ac7]
MNTPAPHLILASTSPRRRKLLGEYAILHRALKPPIDDGQLERGRIGATAWVASLAWLKARSVWDRLDHAEQDAGVVLAADTVVHRDGEILGQPRDLDDARRIVSTLTDGTHRVLTGVCLHARGERTWFVDRSEVRVGAVSPDRIERYLATGDWAGKAGAYNLHERIADGWPIEYEGDDTSIMGLPMKRLLPELERLGIRPDREPTR